MSKLSLNQSKMTIKKRLNLKLNTMVKFKVLRIRRACILRVAMMNSLKLNQIFHRTLDQFNLNHPELIRCFKKLKELTVTNFSKNITLMKTKKSWMKIYKNYMIRKRLSIEISR